MINVCIKKWLEENEYDVDSLDTDDFNDLEYYACEMALQVINDNMEWIGQEVANKFKLKMKSKVR